METSSLISAEETATTQSTSIQTDGIVAVATSVLPPTTPQTFIANGSSSKAVFQIISARHAVIENAYFSGEYPLIQYITCENIGVAVNQPSGQMGLVGAGTVDKQGIKLPLVVFYATVDV